MVAQEHAPLAVVRDRRGLLQDVDDGEPVLQTQRHEQPRHEREVEAHVALVAIPEVGGCVLGPLIGLGEEHSTVVFGVDPGSQLPEEGMGLGKVLRHGPLPLV